MTVDNYDSNLNGPHGGLAPGEQTSVIQANPYMESKQKRTGVYLKKVSAKVNPISSTTEIELAVEENLQELESIITIKSEIQQAEDKGK